MSGLATTATQQTVPAGTPGTQTPRDAKNPLCPGSSTTCLRLLGILTASTTARGKGATKKQKDMRSSMMLLCCRTGESSREGMFFVVVFPTVPSARKPCSESRRKFSKSCLEVQVQPGVHRGSDLQLHDCGHCPGSQVVRAGFAQHAKPQNPSFIHSVRC